MDQRRLLERQSDAIEYTLQAHDIVARVTGGRVTPRWVTFTVIPAAGERISRIRGLGEDIARALGVESVRISQRGHAVAIEVPREDPEPVRLVPLMRQLDWQHNQQIPALTALVGLADDGSPLMIRLPSSNVAHILVAGTTGSGKTVLLQDIILSLALANNPEALSLVLIDPKASAFRPFSGLPHLTRPIIHEPGEAAEALRSAARLMAKRFGRESPAIAIVIDELADLLMTAQDDTQTNLQRLVQRGRSVSIHVVAATQKPTAAVLGPLVKANFPTRLVGRVMGVDDARTATGWGGTGAERLFGRGDFLAIAEGRVIHFQVAHVTTDEIEQIVAEKGWGGAVASPLPAAVIEAAPVLEPAPLDADGDEVLEMMRRLDREGWGPDESYRSACRWLGEAEGGRRFTLVQQAVDLLRATASECDRLPAGDELGVFSSGSGSKVAAWQMM